MKKTVAIITAFCLVISLSGVLVYANTSGYFDRQAIRQMSEEYDEMIKDYANYEPGSRLIIYSDKTVPSLTCIARCDGYKNLHILQFDSVDMANMARVAYCADDGFDIDDVYHDLKLSGSYVSEKRIVDSIEYENHLSDYSDDIYVDDFIAKNIDDEESLPDVNVSVISSGIYKEHDYFQGKDRLVDSGLNLSTSGEVGDDTDDYGLGTICTGVIADNTTSNVKITNYKCLNDNNEAYASSLILAIYNAIENDTDIIATTFRYYHTADRGATTAVQRAVDDATGKGILFCTSPKKDNHADYWNIVTASKQISPIGYKRTVEGDTRKYSEIYYGNNDYTNKDGSYVCYMFAPFYGNSLFTDNKYNEVSDYSICDIGYSYIAACAALTKSVYPDYSLNEVIEYLIKNGRDVKYYSYLKTKVPFLTFRWAHPLTYYKVPKAPVISVESGTYTDEITVELSTDEEEAEIYYQLYSYTNKGSFLYRSQAKKYTKPLTITSHTYLYAKAFYKKDLEGYNSDTSSEASTAAYKIMHSSDEGMFEINEDGFITKYNGTSEELVVPDEVDGITVRGIYYRAFAITSSNSAYDTMTMISLPDTCTYIDRSAFYGRSALKTVEANNLLTAGSQAFSNSGVKNIDLSTFEYIDEAAFYDTPIQEIVNDKITAVSSSAFSRASIKRAVLKNVNTVGYAGFQNCTSLSDVYLPKVETIGKKVFYTVSLGDVNSKFLFAPKLKSTYSLPEYNGTPNSLMLYFSDELESIDYTYNEGEYVTVVAPAGSYAQQWADEGGHNFIDSNSYIDCVGVYENSGKVSFEFEWKKLKDIEQYANDVECYYEVNGEKVYATAFSNSKDYSYLTLTLNENDYPNGANVRAVINIDGMYFKSREFSFFDEKEIEEAYTEPQGECEHNWNLVYFSNGVATLKCDNCDEFYKVRFSKKVNSRFASLDLNNDNIVNGKDYALLLKNYNSNTQ